MVCLKEQLAATVMDNEDPQGGLCDLLVCYDDPFASASKLCSMIANTRRFITSQDRYRHPDYVSKVQELMSPMHRWSEDYQRLEFLLHAPLRRQQSVYISKIPYLVNDAADSLLKEIRPCQDPFYEFVLPRQIMREARAQREQRMLGQQYHMNHERDFYQFSVAEGQQYITTARSVLRNTIDSPSSYYEMIAAVGFLTGRRNYEVMVTINLYPGPMILQANVVGLCKKGISRQYEAPVPIPLLAPYPEIDEALYKIRNYRSYEDRDCGVVSGNSSRGISRACKRLFGRVLSHTQKRNMYSELAYRDKENNGFCVGNQSCSKNAWVAAALGHVPNFGGHTCRYQTMTMTN